MNAIFTPAQLRASVEAAAALYGFTLSDVWQEARAEGLNDWEALNALIDRQAAFDAACDELDDDY